MIVVTTCRRPTQRIRSFAKDLANSHPSTILLTRGKTGLVELAAAARNLKSNRIATVSRWMGGPGRIEFLNSDTDPPSQLIVYLKDVRLRREHGKCRTGKAEIVTTPETLRSETYKFAGWYSNFFGLELLDIGLSRRSRVSIHISEDSNLIRVALISPPSETRIGPSFTISRIDWGKAETAR